MVTLLPAGNRFTTGGSAAGADAGTGAGAGAAGAATAVSTTVGAAGTWVFTQPEIGVPQNGWFIMENHLKMDDLGVPLFSETPIYQLPFGSCDVA